MLHTLPQLAFARLRCVNWLFGKRGPEDPGDIWISRGLKGSLQESRVDFLRNSRMSFSIILFPSDWGSMAPEPFSIQRFPKMRVVLGGCRVRTKLFRSISGPRSTETTVCL